MREAAGIEIPPRLVALVGNPNSGKSSVFNALTGLRQRVSNYPGVTVERREGRVRLNGAGFLRLLDLPGTYSLIPTSPDERITVGMILGSAAYGPAPDAVVCIVDATNLERNLYLVAQVIELGIPVVVALTMVDLARSRGLVIRTEALAAELGVPVVPTAGNTGEGIPELRRALEAIPPPPARAWRLPEPVERLCGELATALASRTQRTPTACFRDALALLTSPAASASYPVTSDTELTALVQTILTKLNFLGIDLPSVVVTSRYGWIRPIVARSTDRLPVTGMPLLDRMDAILTHRVWGVAVFLGIMALVFQAIFTWATIPMEWIGAGFDSLAHILAGVIPPGDLRDLLISGGLAGVAAVVAFLPQIIFLFFFLGLLEDTGYMARAAYVMHRLMSRVGLHGKSFIPLLGSFACAVPGIMAARTIESEKDRLVTILVAPLMSCSARLPVFTLLIGAFVPGTIILGIFTLTGLTLLGLYLFGLVMALLVAWIFKRTLLRGGTPELLIELPPYRAPSLRHILYQTWDRAWQFLKNAGTIILAASIVLWFLASYPRLEGQPPAVQLQQSFAGMAGRAIEPLIEPLGFNWKIGIGLVSSLLQREVFVSTMATIYNIENNGAEDWTLSLQRHMQQDTDPQTGESTYTTLTAICLLVYYVLAMQCLSTVAVVRRETGGWKWPVVQIAYMTALAYGTTFLVQSAGTWLGWGGS